MVIPKQYPYDLYVKVIISPELNGNGDYVGGSESWVFASKCRDENNSRNAVITTVDSETIAFEAVVQLPKTCPEISYNDTVEVRYEGAVRVKGTCKGFRKDQLHSRLWI